jgi:xylulokinase
MTSLLVGRTSPIDLADAAGMNLLDLRTARWSETMMAACAPDLEGRLPAVTPSTRGVGAVASYHVERYGFRPHTPVGTFTGDNPSSLVGLGATTPGDTVVSLGTSDTYFAATAEPRVDPSGFGHVFGNPAGGFMSLVCFANGSLAREHVRDECGLGWAEFEAALASTPPGNDDNLLLPYFAPEMTPRIPDASPERIGSEAFVNGADAPASIRAVVEAQAITMRLHSTWFGPRPARIRVTGGASQNRGILQILADVLEADLQPLERSNASAMGAALRAAHVFGGTPWEALYARFAAPDPTRIVRSRPETRSTYARLTEAFERALQRKLVALSSLHPAG